MPKDFLERVFEKSQGRTYLSTLPEKRIVPFSACDISQALQWADEAVKRSQNVYFVPVTLNRELREGERGTVADVAEVLGFGADCDVFNATKPNEALPKTQEEAVNFLMALPNPPSLIINSGNGIQPLWLFNEPYTIADEDVREHAKKLLRGFQHHIRRLAKEAHGWQWDSTADLVRIYRLPGTLNFKDPINPKNTGILHTSDVRYPINFFETFIQTISERPKVENDAGPAKLVVNNCLFCQYCRDNPDTIGYQFPANSENARSLVRWLAAFEEANELPEVESVSKLGWYGEQYVPVDNILVDADAGCADFIGAYQAKGELSVWKDHAAKARINPYARFLMAAACVAPLMKFAEIRSFLVLLWESSRQGKSAAMNIAASIWGNPTECLMQLNSTPVFIERLATFHNTATIYLDEKQSAQNPKNLEFFCYLIANGRGKGRGNKLGIQQTAKWRTVAILTGEEPLTNSSSLAGVKTRILEVRGKPFDNESDSRNVYTWAAQNYGHAGKIFIEKVKETSKEELRSDLEEIRRQLIEEFPEIIGSHIDALAAIGLADLLLSKSVFATMTEIQKPEYQAFIEAETAKMLTVIADGLETASEVSDANRAEDFIESFIAQNNSKLQKDANGQIGEERDGILFLLTDVLDKALKEAGFSYSKARSELRDAGYFKTFIQNKKPMATTKRRFNGGEPRMYGIRRGKVSQVSHGVS